MTPPIHIIGGGLAGSEAAWQIAQAGVPVMVLLILVMMLVPLPALLLDLLFTLNIGMAIMVLIAALNVKNFKDFVSFPTLLLITTLMRLSLNVASTRIVLLNGHSGTDAAGKATIALPLPQVDDPAHPLEMRATVRVAEGSGRPVERQVTQLLAPATPMIGVKPMFDGVAPEGAEARFSLIGIGTGNPDHLTVQAIKAMRGADLILIPKKGPDKSDLAGLRQCHHLIARGTDGCWGLRSLFSQHLPRR